MNTIVVFTAWALTALVLGLAALVMPTIAFLHNPLACVGVGLVGLGLCKEGRQRLIRVSKGND